MNSLLISQVLTQLSTLKGFPPLPAPKGEADDLGPVAASYAVLLSQLPDATLQRFFERVTIRYDERPSVKALAGWAAEIVQSTVSVPDYLAVGNGLARITDGAETGAASALRLLTDAARSGSAAGSPVPSAAKEAIRAFRDRVQADARASSGRTTEIVIVPAGQAGDWGLEYVRAEGGIDKFPARWSETAARAKARKIAAKYPHLTVRVWCQSAVCQIAADE